MIEALLGTTLRDRVSAARTEATPRRDVPRGRCNSAAASGLLSVAPKRIFNGAEKGETPSVGIGFVFLVYLVALAVLLVPAVALFAGMGYLLARHHSKRVRIIFVFTACLLPVAGSLYLVGCLILTAIVGLATGHDVGFGDGFDLPLHNHYHWSAIDETDSAFIYDAQDRSATDGRGDIHIEDDDRNAFGNVLELQEEGDWLADAYGSHNSRFDHPSSQQVPDHWFLFNTRTHQRIDAGSEAELEKDAVAQGFQLRLQSSDAFYSSNRWTWVDGMAALLLLIPPFAGCLFLWKAAKRLLRGDLRAEISRG